MQRNRLLEHVPSTWNYEFGVTAFNRDLESEKSNCVVAPKEATENLAECML